MAGCNLEQSLESTVMGALNRIRNEASEVHAAACGGCHCTYRKHLFRPCEACASQGDCMFSQAHQSVT